LQGIVNRHFLGGRHADDHQRYLAAQGRRGCQQITKGADFLQRALGVIQAFDGNHDAFAGKFIADRLPASGRPGMVQSLLNPAQIETNRMRPSPMRRPCTSIWVVIVSSPTAQP
jgi:hypothetical protein